MTPSRPIRFALLLGALTACTVERADEGARPGGAASAVAGVAGGTPETADLLLLGGTVHVGDGQEGVAADVSVTGDRISFVGDAAAEGVQARDTVPVTGLMVTPGFIDMHSHAELGLDYGRDARPFLFQGITTVVMGVDGGGDPTVAETLEGWERSGIGVNALTYVGHGAIRRQVLGMEDRAPTPEEMGRMEALVREGMEEGAFGLSTGLFYTPGFYAETEEVVDLARAAAEVWEEAIYDTHDRDLGATYRGIGYLASIREGIRIAEESGTRGIFSHFNAQGAHNYGRAPRGAALIEDARARGVEVAAAQHVYTATQSNLRSYTLPGWAAAGGEEAMISRFDDPDTVALLDVQTMEMLEIRGGADRILFGDPRPELNGKTLQQVADEWGLPVPETVRLILREGNAVVMNLDLYDPENTRYLARQPWMMTCTDGRTPAPGQDVAHPRVYGAFTKKLAELVLDEEVVTMPFAVRSMTGLAADFLRLDDRGYVRPGMKADLAVLDRDAIRDRATYENPHQVSEGTVHVLVNGIFAIRDGAMTGEMAGRALRRPGWTEGGAP